MSFKRILFVDVKNKNYLLENTEKSAHLIDNYGGLIFATEDESVFIVFVPQTKNGQVVTMFMYVRVYDINVGIKLRSSMENIKQELRNIGVKTIRLKVSNDNIITYMKDVIGAEQLLSADSSGGSMTIHL